MAWDRKVPFDKGGNLITYIDRKGYGFAKGSAMTRPDAVVWRDVYEFYDTLIFKNYYKGRSSSGMIFQDSNGKLLTFGLGEVGNLFEIACGKGIVTGKFSFKKQGTNFMAKVITE